MRLPSHDWNVNHKQVSDNLPSVDTFPGIGQSFRMAWNKAGRKRSMLGITSMTQKNGASYASCALLPFALRSARHWLCRAAAIAC